MENRNRLIFNAMVTRANDHAAREAAKAMAVDVRQVNPECEITPWADKGYDAAGFIKTRQDMKITPHMAHNKSNRRSAAPDEIVSIKGYSISQQKRKLIERGFGWPKFIDPTCQVIVRGIKKVHQFFLMTMATYNLLRMRTLRQIGQEVAHDGGTHRNGLRSSRHGPQIGRLGAGADPHHKKTVLMSAARLPPLGISAVC